MVKPVDEARIKYLDPKIRILWALNAVVFAFLMWLFATWLAGLAFPDNLMGVHPSFYPFMFLMAVGVVLIPYLVWVELRYRSYTYYMADTEMIIRRGVLRIERTAIPFEKVQNVNVSRSILERILGLATVKIETAGTNPGEAEGIIPGMGNYRVVVDEILERVEHARAGVAVARDETRPPQGIDDMKKEIAAMREELQGLREEKERLEKMKETPEPEEPPQEPALEFEGERYKKGEEKRISPRKGKKK